MIYMCIDLDNDERGLTLNGQKVSMHTQCGREYSEYLLVPVSATEVLDLQLFKELQVVDVSSIDTTDSSGCR